MIYKPTKKCQLMTLLPAEKVEKKRLAYPVCDGWFTEFYVYARDWINAEKYNVDDWIDGIMTYGTNHMKDEFVMEPMCNHHQGGVYLSRPYWEAMVKMFGHSPEPGVVSYDPDAVEPVLVTYPQNTMATYEPDAEGDCCDIMEDIMLSRGLTIKPDVGSC